MNCMICFAYGLPIGHPSNWRLLIINGGNFLFEVTYICIFYKFSPADLRVSTVSFFFWSSILYSVGLLLTLKLKNYIIVVGVLCQYFIFRYTHNSCLMQDKISRILAGELAYVILVLPLVLYGICILYGIYTPDVLGIHCIITGTLMYGSPTIIIVRYFNFALINSSLLVNILWYIYWALTKIVCLV